MFDNKIGNIVTDDRHKTDIRDYLGAFECPDCGALFTIELSEDSGKWQKYARYSAACPVCRAYHDWTEYKISLTEFKFIRSWRDFKRKTKLIKERTKRKIELWRH